MNSEQTDADIFAERNVRGNRFSMTTLSFSKRHTANSMIVGELFRTEGFLPDGFDVEAIRLKNDGKLNSKYHMSVQQGNGDAALCNAMRLDVMYKGEYKYKGSLLGFSLNAVMDSPFHDWVFFLSLNDNNTSLQGKSCTFTVTAKSYRNQIDEQGGLFAQVVISNSISSGTWK